MPFPPFGRFVALAEPDFERRDDADYVLLRHLHRPSQRLVRRTVAPGCLAQAAVPSATAAALPQVTMPHSAPVNSAIRLLAASISSSRLTNWREAASTAARTCGSIRLPPCIVRTLQQLMNGRTPSARYGLELGSRAGMSPPTTTMPDYNSARAGLLIGAQRRPI